MESRLPQVVRCGRGMGVAKADTTHARGQGRGRGGAGGGPGGRRVGGDGGRGGEPVAERRRLGLARLVLTLPARPIGRRLVRTPQTTGPRIVAGVSLNVAGLALTEPDRAAAPPRGTGREKQQRHQTDSEQA